MSEDLNFPCHYCKHFKYLGKFGSGLYTHCKKSDGEGRYLHPNFYCGQFKINKAGKEKLKMLERSKK